MPWIPRQVTQLNFARLDAFANRVLLSRATWHFQTSIRPCELDQRRTIERSAWFVGFSSDIVVGVFIGFDDNRPLGSGETGATGPVPVFTEFMQVALRERPARPFVRPRNAVFRTVNGIEEAFRPGTERRIEEVPTEEIPIGPQNYNEILRSEEEEAAGQGPITAPAAPPTAPQVTRKEPAEDLSGLY